MFADVNLFQEVAQTGFDTELQFAMLSQPASIRLTAMFLLLFTVVCGDSIKKIIPKS